jgi:hypothetical protein
MPLEEGEQYFCQLPQYLEAWSPVSCIHGFASRRPTFYDDNNRYNWDRIRTVWNKAWGKEYSDKSVFIEKSPPNIFRFSLLNKEFKNSYFIATLRNPYCQIESWVRHFGGNKKGNNLHDLYVDWVVHAEWIQKAIRELGNRILFVNYEDLLHSPVQVEEQVRKFLPELYDFKVENIVDHNDISLRRLNYKDISMINDAMTDNTMFTIERIKADRTRKLLEYFKYGYFSHVRFLNSSPYKFFTESYIPNWKNNRFVEYYDIGKDGLIHDEVPSWMTYFGVCSPKYETMWYSNKRKI